MDDGSVDNTQDVIKSFQDENKLEIKYYYQENQGKMVAINNLVEYVTGEFIVDCDSDDYFTKDAFKIIEEQYEQNKNDNNELYALCFLKYDTKGNNIGNRLQKEITTMFDLYFKEGENGEKALVFYSKIRKKYKYELENNEKFITEARMFHKMDDKYKIKCINEPIMICEYQENGYTKNILNQFKDNPYGYYDYFKEILQKDMNGVKFKKRTYVIKHFILFGYLTRKNDMKDIKNISNKILYGIMFAPGRIKTMVMFKE